MTTSNRPISRRLDQKFDNQIELVAARTNDEFSDEYMDNYLEFFRVYVESCIEKYIIERESLNPVLGVMVDILFSTMVYDPDSNRYYIKIMVKSQHEEDDKLFIVPLTDRFRNVLFPNDEIITITYPHNDRMECTDKLYSQLLSITDDGTMEDETIDVPASSILDDVQPYLLRVDVEEISMWILHDDNYIIMSEQDLLDNQDVYDLLVEYLRAGGPLEIARRFNDSWAAIYEKYN